MIAKRTLILCGSVRVPNHHSHYQAKCDKLLIIPKTDSCLGPFTVDLLILQLQLDRQKCQHGMSISWHVGAAGTQHNSKYQ
jgi:hypothetical protein